MSEANLPCDIADVIARAEEFLNGGFITVGRYGPTPRNLHKGGKSGKGRAFEWLCRHVSYNEKKCLFWPFFKSEGQPGLVGYRGMAFGPVRLMCLLAHGAPPSDRHRATHTCGRTHSGSINPRHLAWKTASESQCDDFREGRRICYGSMGKLTFSEVAQIRTLGGSRTGIEIGKMFGVGGANISQILRGASTSRPDHSTREMGSFILGSQIRDRSIRLVNFLPMKKQPRPTTRRELEFGAANRYCYWPKIFQVTTTSGGGTSYPFSNFNSVIAKASWSSA
jgi:hypothetical protein